MFVHFEQHDTSAIFIYPSYQGQTASDNYPEPEEQAPVQVQEYDNQKAPIKKNAPKQKPSVHPSVTDKHTDAIHPKRSTGYNLGQIFLPYAQ